MLGAVRRLPPGERRSPGEPTMSEEICMMSAADLVAGYRAGALSPVEATGAALDRIDRHDGTLNAFIIVCREEALESARQSEARWRRGAALGAVDGVPTTIKDLVMIKGHPTRQGSLTSPDQQEDVDAPITSRLLEE